VTVVISKAIRAALAAEGFGKGDVSVYNKGYSLGSTVYVTIKRVEVPLTVVERIANQHENVRRDEATGEILGGGNCFVDVRYAEEALDPLAARINAQFAEGRRRFGPISLEPGPDPWTLRMHQDGKLGLHVDAKKPGDALARALAADSWLDAVDCWTSPAEQIPAAAAANGNDVEALIERGKDVADEMFGKPVAAGLFDSFVEDAASLTPDQRQRLFERIAARARELAPSADAIADMLHGAIEPALVSEHFGAKGADITRDGTTVTLTVGGGVYEINVKRVR